MDAKKINQLLELIGEVVNENGPFKEKRDAVLAQTDEAAETNLQEFCSWFD